MKNYLPHSSIDCAVTTIAREKGYVHSLLRSVRLDTPIQLIVGSPESGFLDRYRSDPHIQIVEVSVKEYSLYRDSTVHHRATFNYWRTLTLGPRHPETNGLLILEDDVIAAHRWRQRLGETIEQIESRFGPRYILALYVGHEVR